MTSFGISADWRGWSLAALILGHLAVAALAVQTTVQFLGRQELPVVIPVVVGLLWGQAILLGQFLVFGEKRPILRVLLAAGWFVLVIELGQPFFRATGGRDALTACIMFLTLPLVFSTLLAAARWSGGGRIELHDPRAPRGRGGALQFSLRWLLALTFMAAVALAGVRFARDAFDEPTQAIIFGILPAVEVFVLLPSLSAWAALRDKNHVWRSGLLVFIALASVIGPLYIGRAKPSVYWMLICPVVLPSVVVVGSLLLARAIGYRYFVEQSTPWTRPE